MGSSWVPRDGAGADDWLQFWGGAFGSLFAVLGAYLLENWRRSSHDRASRSEVINEVLRAYREARAVYDAALQDFPKASRKSQRAMEVRAKAGMAADTLDRLLNKPHLTDGSIAVGSGGIALMRIVIRGAEVLDENDGVEHPKRAHEQICSALALEGAIHERCHELEWSTKRIGIAGRLWATITAAKCKYDQCRADNSDNQPQSPAHLRQQTLCRRLVSVRHDGPPWDQLLQPAARQIAR